MILRQLYDKKGSVIVPGNYSPSAALSWAGSSVEADCLVFARVSGCKKAAIAAILALVSNL
jgi:hypothetical protein